MTLRTLAALALALFAVPAFAKGSVHVRGYTTKSGAYVAPHTRSAPNRTQTDNYSAKGHTNPTTGKAGTQTAKH